MHTYVPQLCPLVGSRSEETPAAVGTADARSAVSKHFSRRRHRGRLWWHHQEGSAVCLSVVYLSSVYQLPIIQPSSVV